MVKIGRFIIEGEIGRGGYGSVYKARMVGPEGFERDVAIKTYLNPAGIGTFLDEARLMSRLQHENIVQVYDLISAENVYFIVMEYIDGYDLSDVILKMNEVGDRFSIEEIIHILIKLLGALDYVHNLTNKDGVHLNIVHRDVSTRNVMITRDGKIKLMDFGIAKFQDQIHQTMQNAIKGNPAYMSPEHIIGGVDRRSDLFSASCVGYALFCGGKTPFEGSTVQEVLKNILEKEVEGLPKETVDVYFFGKEDMYRDFNKILKKGLERDIGKRFQTARDFIDALEEYKLKYLGIRKEYEITDSIARKIRTHFKTQRKIKEISSIPLSLQKLMSYEQKIETHRVDQIPNAAPTIELRKERKLSSRWLLLGGASGVFVLAIGFLLATNIFSREVEVELLVNSMPVSEVYLGDRFLGKTPLSRKVEVRNGENRLRLVLGDGKEYEPIFRAYRKGQRIEIIHYEDQEEFIFED